MRRGRQYSINRGRRKYRRNIDQPAHELWLPTETLDWQKDIVGFFESRGGCATISDLRQHKKWSPWQAWKRISELIEAKKIERRGGGTATYYCLVGTPKDLLEKEVFDFLRQPQNIRGCGGCATIQDFVKYWGISKDRCKNLLQPLIDAGKIKARTEGYHIEYCLIDTPSYKDDALLFLQELHKSDKCATIDDFMVRWQRPGYSITKFRARALLRELVASKKVIGRSRLQRPGKKGTTLEYCLPGCQTLEDKVIAFLVARPNRCATASELAEHCGVAPPVLVRNLRPAIKKKKLNTRGKSINTQYCMPDTPSMEHVIINSILELVNRKGGCITQKELVSHFDLTRSSIRPRLKLLLDRGLLKIQGSGYNTKYCLPNIKMLTPGEDLISFLKTKGGCAKKRDIAKYWNITEGSAYARLLKMVDDQKVNVRGKTHRTEYCLPEVGTLEDDVISFLKTKKQASRYDFASYWGISDHGAWKRLRPLVLAGDIILNNNYYSLAKKGRTPKIYAPPPMVQNLPAPIIKGSPPQPVSGKGQGWKCSVGGCKNMIYPTGKRGRPRQKCEEH